MGYKFKIGDLVTLSDKCSKDGDWTKLFKRSPRKIEYIGLNFKYCYRISNWFFSAAELKLVKLAKSKKILK